MVDSFMELLNQRPNYLRTVQNSFNRNLRVADDVRQADMVRRKVLKASQERPEATVYLELLVWVFNQQRDFLSAMAHVQALDQRNGEDGKRLMDLAGVAAKNNDLETAYECYALVAAKGPQFCALRCRKTGHAQGKNRAGHQHLSPRFTGGRNPFQPIQSHARGPR